MSRVDDDDDDEDDEALGRSRPSSYMKGVIWKQGAGPFMLRVRLDGSRSKLWRFSDLKGGVEVVSLGSDLVFGGWVWRPVTLWCDGRMLRRMKRRRRIVN